MAKRPRGFELTRVSLTPNESHILYGAQLFITDESRCNGVIPPGAPLKTPLKEGFFMEILKNKNPAFYGAMASAGGLDPPTHSLGNCCSILMSYADIL